MASDPIDLRLEVQVGVGHPWYDHFVRQAADGQQCVVALMTADSIQLIFLESVRVGPAAKIIAVGRPTAAPLYPSEARPIWGMHD